MALTPEEIQQLDSIYGVQQPSVASSPVGQVKAYDTSLDVSASGPKSYNSTLAQKKAEMDALALQEAAQAKKDAANAAAAATLPVTTPQVGNPAVVTKLKAIAPGAPEAAAEGLKAYTTKVGSNLADQEASKEKQAAELAKSLADIEALASNIRKAQSMTGPNSGSFWEAGYMGNKLKDVARSDAYKLDQTLVPVRSGVAVNELMDLKKNSATGASPFGSLTAPELALVQNKQGSLELGQGERQLSANLRDIYGNYNNIYKKLSGGKELPPYDAKDPTQPIHYSEYFK